MKVLVNAQRIGRVFRPPPPHRMHLHAFLASSVVVSVQDQRQIAAMSTSVRLKSCKYKTKFKPVFRDVTSMRKGISMKIVDKDVKAVCTNLNNQINGGGVMTLFQGSCQFSLHVSVKK